MADQSSEPLNREGAWAQQAEAQLPDRREREEVERSLAFGLEAAPTINDRRISTFVRGELPHFAGERGTFLKCPFVEDVNQVDDAEVASSAFRSTRVPRTGRAPGSVRREFAAPPTSSGPTTTRWVLICASS